MYREISNSDKKIRSSFLRKCVSWLFRIPRILSHITAFHSVVKWSDFYSSLLLPFAFFWICENDQINFHKKCRTRSENISFKVDPSREWKVSYGVGSRKLFKHSETRHVSVFPHIFQLESKKVPQMVFAPRRSFWLILLVLEPEVNYLVHHEYDCTFAYIQMCLSLLILVGF